MKVKSWCKFRFSVFSFVCALISIIGVFYMVMINSSRGGFFDYNYGDSSYLELHVLIFIIAIFPYLILYLTLYLVWIKTQQGSCKKLYTACTVVLLLAVSITALEWKVLILITTISNSDGGATYLIMFAKVAQIVLSLFVWLMLAFFLRSKKPSPKTQA